MIHEDIATRIVASPALYGVQGDSRHADVSKSLKTWISGKVVSPFPVCNIGF